MKDFVQMWNKVTSRPYSAVNQQDRELKELSNNRLKRSDIDTSAFESNIAECEGLNSKFNDDLDFSERRDAIINRLFERRKKGQVARQPKCLFILLMLGFIFLGAGCFVLFLHPYDFLFRQKVVLQDGGEIFEMWRKPAVDLYVRIFLFNVTNSEEFMAGNDTKIKVKEIGPYVYKETLEHDILGFNPNGTVSAVPRHPLTWVPELSEGNKEDDLVILPHIALLSIANVVSGKDFFTRLALNNLITLTASKPLAPMTAREFMMGYKSRLMTLGNTFMPDWIYFDKLGLIDRAYDFEGDYETVFTGEDDMQNAGLLDTYRGSTDLPHWEGKHCSNIQYASDGTKFKGGVSRNDSLIFYRKNLCRAAPLIPTDEGIKSGLKAYMYTFPEHMMDNGARHEENKCFCRHGKCLPDGLIDVTDCYYGFPIALSYPHFYKGDPILGSRVEGLNPNKEMHETRFWIQPESGLPLDVSAKIQINLALGDLTPITNADKFANMYLPLLWFDIRMYALPPTMEERFKLYLNVLPLVEQAVMYIAFALGAFLIILAVYRLTFKIMFKTGDEKTRNNFFISDLWIDREKNAKKPKPEKDTVYAPCEVPLNETDSDSDPQFNPDMASPSLLKTHADRIKELSCMLSDKVYDSVENVKEKVKYVHVRNIFNNEKNNSLIQKEAETNEAYSNDDTEVEFNGTYHAVRQVDSDDDQCKYLEVVDDGEFDDLSPRKESSSRAEHLKSLDGVTRTDHDNITLYISE